MKVNIENGKRIKNMKKKHLLAVVLTVSGMMAASAFADDCQLGIEQFNRLIESPDLPRTEQTISAITQAKELFKQGSSSCLTGQVESGAADIQQAIQILTSIQP
jgi:hypothetical protein